MWKFFETIVAKSTFITISNLLPSIRVCIGLPLGSINAFCSVWTGIFQRCFCNVNDDNNNNKNSEQPTELSVNFQRQEAYIYGNILRWQLNASYKLRQMTMYYMPNSMRTNVKVVDLNIYIYSLELWMLTKSKCYIIIVQIMWEIKCYFDKFHWWESTKILNIC